jgi:Replication-relaxation
VTHGDVAARSNRLSHLTQRDHELCDLLWEQRVMTTAQLTTVAFGDSIEVARHRLLTLHRLDVVSRFRPIRLRGEGSAPFHYVLGPAGALVLASVRATTVRSMGYRAEHMLALARSPRLAHLVGVNDILTSLTAAARRRGATLASWWSERQCAANWGAVVRPDACGRWREGGVDGPSPQRGWRPRSLTTRCSPR